MGLGYYSQSGENEQAGVNIDTKLAENGKGGENMQLTSKVFVHDGKIPSKYTCDGENVSPPLTMSDVPAGVESLALVVDDPDSPSGDWVHWLIWGIDPKTKEMGEGEVTGGAIEGVNGFGEVNYGGPCPQNGEHAYQFKLYGLNKQIDLPAGASKGELEEAMQGFIVAKSTLLGKYSRGK